MTKKDNPGIGHNSGDAIGGIASEALKQFVARIERLEEEKANIQADIKDVYAQAKSQGFDAQVLRIVIRRRKMDAMEREEIDQLVDLYEGVFA